MKFREISKVSSNGDSHTRLELWQRVRERMPFERLFVWGAIAAILFVVIYLLKSGERIPPIHILSFSFFLLGLVIADRIIASQARARQGERKSLLAR